MKKYMLLIHDNEDDSISTQFYDDYHKVMDAHSIATVSLGYFAQVYVWDCDDDGIYSYQIYYEG